MKSTIELGSYEFFQRFMAFVRPGSDDDCWTFEKTTPTGYGQLAIGGKHYAAHRLAYEAHRGPIPAGAYVCHTCDNPSCVNPLHLFVGTAKDNNDDMMRKGRNRNQYKLASHCKRGHEFNERNTRIYDGRRYCRLCDNRRHKSTPREQ